jgi:hypothetical protein
MNGLYTFFFKSGFLKKLLHIARTTLAIPCVPNLTHVSGWWEHLSEHIETLLGVVPGELFHGIGGLRPKHGAKKCVHVNATRLARKVLAEGLGHTIVLKVLGNRLLNLIGCGGILAGKSHL